MKNSLKKFHNCKKSSQESAAQYICQFLNVSLVLESFPPALAARNIKHALCTWALECFFSRGATVMKLIFIKSETKTKTFFTKRLIEYYQNLKFTGGPCLHASPYPTPMST